MTERSRGSARRAVLRWSWRLFRREWRQQLLLLALVTTTVTAAVSMATVVVNAASPITGQFGAGRAYTRATVADAAEAQRVITAAERRFGTTIEVVRHLSVAVPGSPVALDVRAQVPDGPLGRPMLRLVDGRYPRTADEVALTDGAMSQLDDGTGARTTVDLAGARRRVVGRVENPGDLDDEFALLAATPDAPATSLTILLQDDGRGRGNVDRPTDGAAANAGATDGAPRVADVDFGVVSAGDDRRAVATVVIIGSTMAMALVALVASAGFLVVAQRRQRQLGLLAALGAPERLQRLVIVANGAFVGAVAAIVGGAIGVGVWILVAPAVEAAAAHRIGRFDLPWTLILVCLGLALAASMAAAWWPARTASKQPVMAALARRAIRRAPVRRSAALAIVLVVAGLVAIAAAYPTAHRARPALLMAGLVTLIAGTVLAAPVAVRAVAALAHRLPLAPRLAIRDLARFQSRAAAAVAAITLGLGLCVAVAIAAQAAVSGPDEGNLSSRQLLLSRSQAEPIEGVDATDAAREQLDAAAAKVATALDVAGTPLDIPIAGGARSTNGPVRVEVATKIDANGYRFVGHPYVATDTLLASLHIDPSAVHDTTDLLTALPSDVVLLDPSTRPVDGSNGDATTVQHVDLPSFDDAPKSLVPMAALERHGWTSARVAWVFDAGSPLTHERIVAARTAAAAAGLVVEVRSTQDDLATLRLASTVVGALLALAIVAMTVGLIRGESGGDVRTLTATGAAPRTRRSVTASTAGVLALLGGVLGSLGAYGALAATYHADLGRLGRPPFGPLATIVVGVPLLAACGGWLLAGREPRTFSRVVLD